MSNRTDKGENGRTGAEAHRESVSQERRGPEEAIGDQSASEKDEPLVADIVSLNDTLTEAARLLALAGPVFRPPLDSMPPAGMASGEQVGAFRELRTRLMLKARAKGLTYFTTLVTGLTRDSGASFVARNLAAAVTMQQHIALLLDCNFRNPTQQGALGLEPGGEGLFDFVERPTIGSLSRLICPTGIAGLHLVPAGSSGALAAAGQREVFSSAAMKGFMSRLVAEPCYLFLDAPPVQEGPDARILSDLADLVVLVVGYGRSSTHDLARAVAMFDRSKLAGAVFSEADDVTVSRRRRSARR